MKDLEEVLADLTKIVGENNLFLVGSRVTCNPPPLGTDQDILILDTGWGPLGRYFKKSDWKLDGSVIFEGGVSLDRLDQDFFSYKMGDINVIVAEEEDFFNKFLLATSVATELNLLQKQDRIDLFQCILYGAPPPPFFTEYLKK